MPYSLLQSSARETLDVCPACKFAHADPQAPADSEQVDDSGVVFAALYATQIAPVYARLVRQRFLR